LNDSQTGYLENAHCDHEKQNIYRLSGLLAATAVLWLASSLWGNDSRYGRLGVNVTVFVDYCVFFGLVFGALVFRESKSSSAIQLAVVSCTLAVGYLTVVHYENRSFFGGGQAKLAYATSMQKRGDNPYDHDRFQTGIGRYNLATTTAREISVDPVLTSPNGMILLYRATTALHIPWVTAEAFGFIITTAIVIAVLPATYRVLGLALLVSDGGYYYTTATGGNDMIVVPFITAAATTVRRWPIVGGIFLGLAASIRQDAWFDIVALLVLSTSAKPALRSLAAAASGAASTFVVLNLPYDVISTNEWIYSIGAPFGGLIQGDGFFSIHQAWRNGPSYVPILELSAVFFGSYVLFNKWIASEILWAAPIIGLNAISRPIEYYIVTVIAVIVASMATRPQARHEVPVKL